MYVDAVGTLPPSGMSMLSVQMIPPFSGIGPLELRVLGTSWTTSPDHATHAARSPFDERLRVVVARERRIWPESTAAWMVGDRLVERLVGDVGRVVAVRRA